MDIKQMDFLEQYLSTLTQSDRDAIPQVIAEYFCADEYNANECARLINQGIKRASCSLKAGYDAEDEALPKLGRLSVVLNWAQEPVCIIKLTDVSICPFNKVTPEFATLEGEGDLSYPWWREAHIRFFTKYAASLDIEFTESSDLVLERFEKVYPL
ncbi:ASCH domain-containing protein [Photobacterium satsumensis]|uniref:ASCH domain-containing protein n=1 Tax=Photobacterium satsumensis TaxID=2910239 RepID=UPI003D0D834D